MQHDEAMDQLKSWANRWKQWVGPDGDEYRYKNMAAAAELGADAIAERDQLRAELAAAKNLLARIHRDGGHHTEAVGFAQSVADADAKVSEWLLAAEKRTALAAHVERLVGALDTARVEALWIAQNTAPSGTDSGDLSTNRAARSMVAGIKAALAATPAQSLAAHDAALLREVAEKWYRAGNPSQENAAVYEADRIEKEGA